MKINNALAHTYLELMDGSQRSIGNERLKHWWWREGGESRGLTANVTE